MKNLRHYLANARNEYLGTALSNPPTNPITLFESWLKEAVKTRCCEPTAMHLSTVFMDSVACRTVLLKDLAIIEDEQYLADQPRFVFYTSYASDKAAEISHNNEVELTFFWPELYREVRIHGLAQKIPVSISARYWNSRPIKSRAATLASHQSQPIDSRKTLKDNFFESYMNIIDAFSPCPAWWGGYAVAPITIEFWQGRANRLHDRILYDLDDISKEWSHQRLQP